MAYGLKCVTKEPERNNDNENGQNGVEAPVGPAEQAIFRSFLEKIPVVEEQSQQNDESDACEYFHGRFRLGSLVL